MDDATPDNIPGDSTRAANPSPDAAEATQAGPSSSERKLAILIVFALMVGSAAIFGWVRGTWEFDITRPFSTPAGLVGLAVVVLPLAAAQFFMARWGVRWTDYGMHRRDPLWKVLVFAAIGTAALFLALPLLRPLIMAIATVPPDMSHLMNLPGNLPGLIFALVAIWITAAFVEEMVCRGFLLNETATVLGGGRLAYILAVLLVGLAFGLAHAYQGPSGMIMTGALGVLIGALYLAFGRNLWPVILAHGAFNSWQLWQVYLLA